GLAILATSRPYEGLVFGLPVAIALFAWMLGRNHPCLDISVRRVVLPLVVLLGVTGLAMGYYCWRVTGHPFRMPYQLEQQQYAVAPYMLWEHVRPEPAYRHAVIRRMYVDEALVGYNFFRTPIGMLFKAWSGWTFFLGPLLTFPILMSFLSLPYGFSLRLID